MYNLAVKSNVIDPRNNYVVKNTSILYIYKGSVYDSMACLSDLSTFVSTNRSYSMFLL